MGAFATWDLLARYPGRFAVAVPISGGGDPSAAARMVSSPRVWAWHGRHDNIVAINASRLMVAAVARARHVAMERTAPDADDPLAALTVERRSDDDRLRLTELPSGHHGAWMWALNQTRLVEWMTRGLGG